MDKIYIAYVNEYGDRYPLSYHRTYEGACASVQHEEALNKADPPYDQDTTYSVQEYSLRD